MKHATIAAAILLAGSPALAELPMGLKCEPSVKIAGAEIGEETKYEVKKGMAKEEHRAILNRKKATPVDKCHYKDLKPGQLVVVRYSGPEVSDTEVQCIDQNNNNELVKFPKSIYTVRNSDVSPWMLMHYCPDGKSLDGFPCSKADSQSQRSTEYKDTVLKWKGNEKNKLYKIDLRFDPAFQNSVPSNAKLFCALINRAGNVVIAGSAQYPEWAAAAPDAAPDRSRGRSRQATPTDTQKAADKPADDQAPAKAADDQAPAAGGDQ